MALKMRQSLAELEQEFRDEMQLDRTRREQLRKQAVARSRYRTRQRRQKRSSMRFWLLVFTLILTAVGVTFGMFAALRALLASPRARVGASPQSPRAGRNMSSARPA